MGKRLCGVLIGLIFLASATTAYAQADDLMEGMTQKFIRGVVNTFTGWVEFPAQIIKGYNEGFMGDEDNKIVGAVVGIFEGFGHAAGRTFSGITEMFGFWAANPASNEGIGLHLDAEYAWEEGEPYDIFDPTFTDATVIPLGNKLLRGLSNSLLGIVEVPGQIAKGISEGAPDLGIIKGIWYWWSRGVYGFNDLGTLLFPNPPDQKGMAFDEEWPWEALTESMQ